jgi:hypothetical protein
MDFWDAEGLDRFLEVRGSRFEGVGWAAGVRR